MDSPSSPWATVAPMPKWWEQEHRMIEGHPSGAWICTCGALGRREADTDMAVLFGKHIKRVQERFVAFAKKHPRAHTPAPFYLRRLPGGGWGPAQYARRR